MLGLASLIEDLLISLFSFKRSERLSVPPAAPETDGTADFAVGEAVIAGPRTGTSKVTVSERDRSMHIAITGATGVGKTTAILRLIASDVKAGRTAIVIDRRNDFVNRLLPRLVCWGIGPERLVLVDLADESHVFRFNPLAGRGEALGRSLGVLALLRREAEGWGVQIDETARCTLMALAETGNTLLEVEALLTNPEFRASVVAHVTDPYVLAFFERFESLSKEKQLSWVLPITNKMSPLLSVRPIRNMLGCAESTDLRRILDTPGMVVLVGLGVDKLRQASDLAGGMFLTAIQQAVLGRVDVHERDRRPVRLYCDEFEAICTDDFSVVVQEGRRFGLHLTLAHQNLSQIPPRLLETIRNNCALRLMFNCGPMDASHLAPELQGMTRDEARSALTSLDIGEAFLVSRGRDAVRVRTYDAPDPDVSPIDVSRLRRESLTRWCISAAAAESERMGRAAAIAGFSSNKYSIEVRHDKKPRVNE